MRPSQNVQRLRVAYGAHALVVHGDQVVARLYAPISGQGAARCHGSTVLIDENRLALNVRMV